MSKLDENTIPTSAVGTSM